MKFVIKRPSPEGSPNRRQWKQRTCLNMLLTMGFQTVIRAVLKMTTNVIECTGEPPVRSLLPTYPTHKSAFRGPIDQNSVHTLAIRRRTRASEPTRYNKLESSKTSDSWLRRLRRGEMRSVAQICDDCLKVFTVGSGEGMIQWLARDGFESSCPSLFVTQRRVWQTSAPVSASRRCRGSDRVSSVYWCF